MRGARKVLQHTASRRGSAARARALSSSSEAASKPVPPPTVEAPPAEPAAGDAAMTPREIVGQLDAHIVGQASAKRAVAIALRNRWRRQLLGG